MKHSRLFSVVLIAISISVPFCAHTQSQANAPQASTKDQPMDPELAKDRRYALELFNDPGSRVEAVSWLEKVAAALPLDAEIQEALGIALYNKAATLAAASDRKALRLRALEHLERAKKLGDKSELLQFFLSTAPSDGEDPTASENPAIDRALKDGEADFATGRYEEAKKHYLQALYVEPNNYLAQLLIGDVYFSQAQYAAANEWFARAAASDPNLDIAYRYWGDSFMRMQDYSAARDKFINAIIASPYARENWAAADNWAQAIGQKLTFLQISPASTIVEKDGKFEISLAKERIDEDNTVPWLGYGLAKKMWRESGFKEAFPGQPYRHTLKEESRGLTGAALVAIEHQKAKKGIHYEQDIDNLMRLHSAGFIEPFVLLTAADEAIAQDYLQFRSEHRDLLVRFLSEIVFPPAPNQMKH